MSQKARRAGVLLAVAAGLLLIPRGASAGLGATDGSLFRLSFHASRPNEETVIALASISGSRFSLAHGLFVETVFAVDFHYAAGSLNLVLGNPTLGLGWQGELAPRLRLNVAGSLALPLTLLNAPGPVTTLAYRYAAGMDGGWNLWLWADDRLSLAATGRLTALFPERYFLAAELGFAPGFWFGTGPGETIFVLQGAAEGGYQPTDAFSFGGRFKLVVAPPPGGQTSAAAAMELFLRLHDGGSAYELRLTLPVNAPYGFGFAPGGIYGVHVSGGTLF